MAMAGTNIPAGWHYDAFTDSYKSTGGDVITRRELDAHHGSIDQVLVHRAYDAAKQSMAANVTSTGAIGQITNGQLSPANPFITGPGQFAVASVAPAATITIQGKLGNITINLDTGELTIPPNVGRDDAIRDFWLAFQEHFQPTNKTKYEMQIKKLERELAETKNSATLMREADTKAAHKRVAAKVAKKYGNEKFIMIKPDDLIKFIQDF